MKENHVRDSVPIMFTSVSFKVSTLQMHDTQWNLTRINAKKSLPRDIIKLLKTNSKQKNVKSTREKGNTYAYRDIILNDGRFFIKIQPAVNWKQWDIFQILKEKKCQPRSLYFVKLSFRNEGKIKIFSDEGKLENLLPAEMFLKKWKREFFRLNKNGNGRQLGVMTLKGKEQT